MLVTYFASYKEYNIRQMLFSKFSDVLLAFTFARGIGKFWNSCLGVSIFRNKRSEALTTRAKLERCPVPKVGDNGNIPFLKALRKFSVSSKNLHKLSIVFIFCCFFLWICWSSFFVNIHNLN